MINKEKIKFLLIVWTLGITGGLIVWLLRGVGIIKIYGFKKNKVAPPKEGLVCFYRHPSLWEPFILPFVLSFPWVLFNLNWVPSTPDARNFYRKKWYIFLRPVSIPISRGNSKREGKALKEIKEKLKRGSVILIAPGGGRERKAKEVKLIRKNGKIEVKKIASEAQFQEIQQKTKGKIIRRFKQGISWLHRETEAFFLPVWVGIQGVKIIIKLGKRVRFENLSEEAILESLENNLLKLAES